MKNNFVVWSSEDTQKLVEQLLNNADYFSDVENDYQEFGPFDGHSLQELVAALTDIWFTEEIDLEEVDWSQAAQVVCFNIDIVPSTWVRTN